MGVDYDASFGIGYEVKGYPEELDEEDDFSLEEHLEELITTDCGYKCIHWGNEFSGNGEGFAIVLDKLPELDDLEEELAHLRCFFASRGLEYDESTYLVGGAHVW